MTLDINKIKADFPILSRKIEGNRLVYFDNAATSQKPASVINAISDYYLLHNANIHRGVHTLSDEATGLYESARDKVAKFIGAARSSEIIFNKNATDGLNMAALGWGTTNLKAGDIILTTLAEHNSSVLPWQLVAKTTGAKLEYLSVDANGYLSEKTVRAKLQDSQGKVKVLAVAHASNVLGTIFDIKAFCRTAKEFGVTTFIDGAQAIPHIQVNMQSLGCDFYAFSAHKMLGPMGCGVLYGRQELLEKMPPVQLGGGTVLDVDLESYDLVPVPDRFEAGTPDVAGAVGLAAAIDYLMALGMDAVRDHEIVLSAYAIEHLQKIAGLTILGPLNPQDRTGLVAFTLEGIHPHDLGAILNSKGVAVRSGMHCAMNLHKSLNVSASTRVSYYIYNDTSDIDILIDGINTAIKLFR